MPEAFSHSGEEEVPGRWWLAFEDEQLNTLMDSALRTNLSLRVVWQQLREARAVVKRSSAPLLPAVDLGLQSGISRPEPDFVGGENTQLSLGSSYEVDLWGRIRYSLHAEEFRMEASLNDYRTAAVSLSGEIAATWFQMKATLNQILLVEQQIETNQQMLLLIRARFGSGQIRGVDILRQQQLIESTKAQRITLQTQFELLKNQLTVLLGQPPGVLLSMDTTNLPDPPSLPNTGIPLQLVNRRPDVLSAFHNLQASDRDMAAAISNRYPRMSFNLTAAIRSNTFSNLLQSQAVSLSGSLLAPLFYGGSLNAEVDRTEAVRRQSLNSYAQTVLTAFQEVENALMQEEKQFERIAVVREQIDLAERAYSQLRIAYLNGSSEYLDVLTALNQEQQLRRDLIDARLGLIQIRIALYRALAGGFDTPRDNLNG